MACSECTDAGLMPRHMPMPVDEDGRGPAEEEAVVKLVCWCGNPECMWTKAFAEQADVTTQRCELGYFW